MLQPSSCSCLRLQQRGRGPSLTPLGTVTPGADADLHSLPLLSHQVFHCVHFECPEQQNGQKDNSDESGTGDAGAAGQQLDPHALQAPSGSSLPSSPGSNSRSPTRQHQ